MNLRSFLADQTGQEQAYIVLNTTTNMGSFLVGLEVGKVSGGEALVTPVGQACLNRIAEIADQSSKTVHVVEVAGKNKLREKVRGAFLRATARDCIFFVCGNGKLYDDVFKELNFQAPDATSHATH